MANLKRAVLFFSDASPHAAQRAVALFRLMGCQNLIVYRFERENSAWSETLDGVEIVIVGKVPSRKYFSRLPVLILAGLKILWREYRYRGAGTVYYASMLDSALIALAVSSSKSPVIYEVIDLRVNPRSKRIWQRLISAIDCFVASRANALVVTASGFLSEYYARRIPGIATKTVVLEPKLPRYFIGTENRGKLVCPSRPIKLSYIGFVRYKSMIESIIRSVGKRPDAFEFHLFGSGVDENLLKLMAQFPNVFNHGPFVASDRSRIYAMIDLSCAIYDNTDPNVQLAIPNKLFESLYYGVPLVVSADTELSRRVAKYQNGFVVDPREIDFAEKLLDQISVDRLALASQASLQVPDTELVMDFDLAARELSGLLRINGSELGE